MPEYKDTPRPDGVDPLIGDSGTREDPQTARLREQEQLWLQLVALLHEHQSKLGTEESRIVLDVAKRRWVAAKAALNDHLARR